MTPMGASGGALGALEASWLGRAMRQLLWLYPSVEIVHIVGIALLFGSIAVLDLRLLGLSRSLSIASLARHTLPWTVSSLFLIVPSGALMFTAHASDLAGSPVFLLKMVLILAAGLNAAVFHFWTSRGTERWDLDVPPARGARVAGALSLLLWVAVIACGRLLAYF